MKIVLILGKGYIGNYLNNYLLADKEFKVIHISKKDIDYTNPIILKKFLSDIGKISWVVNCSGYTGTPNVDSCEDNKEECYYYNVTVPLYLTKIFNNLNIPIIHIGSGCIYTGYDDIYTENHQSNFGADCFDSSFYSKTKDTFEKLSHMMDRYIFRIRMPFNSIVEPKNIIYKILKYDNLISKPNSLTCVDDLLCFIKRFINTCCNSTIPFGVYNVVNSGAIDASQIVDILKAYGIENTNWKFVSVKSANFKASRSNCILSTKKIEDLYLPMPHIMDSIEKAIENYSYNLMKIL